MTGKKENRKQKENVAKEFGELQFIDAARASRTRTCLRRQLGEWVRVSVSCKPEIHTYMQLRIEYVYLQDTDTCKHSAH